VLGALLERGETNLEVLWAILQFRAGLRTAMVLATHSTRDLAVDEVAQPLLDQLAAFPIESRQPTAITLRSALQERYAALSIDGLTSAPLLDVEKIRQAIDSRTVVLTTATTADSDGRPARVALLIWDQDAVMVGTGPLPEDDDLPVFPGGVLDQLALLARQGKDHLCVYADAGLQVLRWHLLPVGEGLLADHWVVTLLPHPTCSSAAARRGQSSMSRNRRSSVWESRRLRGDGIVSKTQ
jgi:hypothetical protein